MLSSSEFHKEFLALRISTHEIGVEGLNFKQNISSEALSALLFEKSNETFSWKALSPVEINFFLERESDHSFKITVSADFSLQSTCVRCLNRVNYSFLLKFSTRMLEREHLGMTTETLTFQFESDEIESSYEEIAVSYFAKHHIDLGLILRDQIFLQAPDYPHCSDSMSASPCSINLDTKEVDDRKTEKPFLKLLNKIK